MIFNKPIIAITGSAGKTMVKTLTSAVLRQKWEVFEPNHYNNTFQKTEEHAKKIDESHQAAVLEYGMAFAGALTKHCDYIEPNISVITNVGLAHIENFDSDVRLLAKAKSEIIKGMKKTGKLYLNADDINSKLLETDGFKGEIITIGIDADADFRASNIEYLDTGIRFCVLLNEKTHIFFIPLFGRHNVYNALFAIAVSHMLGFSPMDMRRALKNIRRPEHRLDVIKLKNNITIIDDTVHANPVAVKAAIDVLDQIAKHQKIVVLGSMSELGEKSVYHHRKIGRYLKSKNVDYVFTHGNVSVDIGKGAMADGFSKRRVSHKTRLKRNELFEELIKTIRPGATVLIKGFSRLKMSEIVDFLCNHYGFRNVGKGA